MKVNRRISPLARFVDRLGHCATCHVALAGRAQVYNDEGLNFCSREHWRAWTMLPR